MTDKQTERTKCDFCHQTQYCRRVRKPKRGLLGRITYDFAWLCEICVYNVKVL
jgi:Pyruvate/2-oxoacid:ferredoxin oxidoreductase delta subunit